MTVQCLAIYTISRNILTKSVRSPRKTSKLCEPYAVIVAIPMDQAD